MDGQGNLRIHYVESRRRLGLGSNKPPCTFPQAGRNSQASHGASLAPFLVPTCASICRRGSSALLRYEALCTVRTLAHDVNMGSLLCSVLLAICVLCRAATLPHFSSTRVSTLNGTRNTLIPSPQSLRYATRQLPEHECALHITYQYTRRLPDIEWRFALTRAQLQIETDLARYGDDGLVIDDITIAETTVFFAAESDRHSPTVELTYGVLKEAWFVLVDFLERRPHPLKVVIVDGMDGRGPPLGEVLLYVYRRCGRHDLLASQTRDSDLGCLDTRLMN